MLVLGACSGENARPSSSEGFVDPGPFDVGVRTLVYPDRQVEVFYPTEPDSAAGGERVAYDVTSGFSEALAAAVPDELRRPVIVDAYRGRPASGDGPFPLVIFSHGFAASRAMYATLLTGIASWGFVVASVEYPEHNLEALLTNQLTEDRARDAGVVDMTIDRLAAEGEAGGSLAGAVDVEKVGVVGHSAGGTTALLYAARHDRADVVVSWAASVAPAGSSLPTMIIVGDGDVETLDARSDIDVLTGPVRLVTLQDSGHSVFWDVCPDTVQGQGLLARAESLGFVLPADLRALAVDGCEQGDTPTTTAWPTIQHFTVAQLRDAFDIGRPGAGLGADVVDEVPAEVNYLRAPD